MWSRHSDVLLQFQLTVNFVALVLSFVAAISNGETPLTVIQLLWVNLIMDALGALGDCCSACSIVPRTTFVYTACSGDTAHTTSQGLQCGAWMACLCVTMPLQSHVLLLNDNTL